MERVGIYNRCSTEEESQRNALAAQVMESREIAERKGWEITEQYIESETGTVAYKRGEYQRLLADMERGRFDIVMIKSIDRLMRSAKDWYLFLNRLTENRLRLYIYIEGKFYTPDDNLISGIKAILAEDFSRELSKKIKNAHKRRQEKKSGCNITCRMFGWNKVAKDLYEINEKEAEYYRTAFLLAEEGKGFYTISNTLYALGARGRQGQKISQTQWRKMLYTPRAHGAMVLNQRTYNFDLKKYEEVPREEWVVVEDALPPIVTREYQEKVLALLRKRAESSRVDCPGKRTGGGEAEKKDEVKRRPQGKYELSRRIVCACCGNYYYRVEDHRGKKVYWKCAGFLEGGRERGCKNLSLTEEEVMEALEKAFQERYGQCAELSPGQEELSRGLMEALKKTLAPQREEKEDQRLEKDYQKLSTKKDILMEKLLSSVITDEEFRKYNDEIACKMKAIEDRLRDIKREREPYNSYETRLKQIEEAIREEKLIARAMVRELLGQVRQIRVYGDGRLSLSFEGEEPCTLWAQYVHRTNSQRRKEADRKEILRLLQKEPELHVKELSGQMGRSPSYINGRIRELKEEGALVYVRQGQTGRWVVYPGSGG